MNLNVNSAHRQRKSLVWTQKTLANNARRYSSRCVRAFNRGKKCLLLETFNVRAWSELDLEHERNISGAFALAASDWAERTSTKRNIELSVTPLRCAHMRAIHRRIEHSTSSGTVQIADSVSTLLDCWKHCIRSPCVRSMCSRWHRMHRYSLKHMVCTVWTGFSMRFDNCPMAWLIMKHILNDEHFSTTEICVAVYLLVCSCGRDL